MPTLDAQTLTDESDGLARLGAALGCGRAGRQGSARRDRAVASLAACDGPGARIGDAPLRVEADAASPR